MSFLSLGQLKYYRQTDKHNEMNQFCVQNKLLFLYTKGRYLTFFIRSSGFLFLQSSGFGLLDQLIFKLPDNDPFFVIFLTFWKKTQEFIPQVLKQVVNLSRFYIESLFLFFFHIFLFQGFVRQSLL